MPTEEKEGLKFVGIKMSKGLVEAIDIYVARGTHTTRSEFIRTAIINKLKHDSPEFWAKVLKKVNIDKEEKEIESNSTNPTPT